MDVKDAARYRALRSQAWVQLEIEASEWDEEADALVALYPDSTMAPSVPNVAEFEIHAGGEYFASTSGPREAAFTEAMNYIASLHPFDGEPEMYEVTRTRMPLPSALNSAPDESK